VNRGAELGISMMEWGRGRRPGACRGCTLRACQTDDWTGVGKPLLRESDTCHQLFSLRHASETNQGRFQIAAGFGGLFSVRQVRLAAASHMVSLGAFL
jgi:hypothetical protein